MSTTALPAPYDHRTGRNRELGSMDLYLATEAEHLVPADVLTARATVHDLKARVTEAMGESYRLSEAIKDAEKADTEALATALAAGDDDPGTPHADAARKAAAEAKRHLDALEVAEQRARVDYWQACEAADFTEAKLGADAMAADLLPELRDLIAKVDEVRDRYYRLRSMALNLDAWPMGSQGVHRDEADMRRATQLILEAVDAMAWPPLLDASPAASEPDAAA